MYLTHYGRVGDVPRLRAQLLDLLQAMVDIALRHREAAQRHARLRESLLELYLRSLRSHGCDFSDTQVARLLEMDVELNAQGLAVWLDRR